MLCADKKLKHEFGDGVKIAYRLAEVTIKTNNSKEGLKQIEELWQDISTGRLPILFDSEGNFLNNVSPISRYSHYESDETGNYNLSILIVTADFFKDMDSKVLKGRYKKYDFACADGDLSTCAKLAWEKVWNDQKNGKIKRTFSVDYESTVPAQYSKDGCAHCFLYIAIDSSAATKK